MEKAYKETEVQEAQVLDQSLTVDIGESKIKPVGQG